MTTTAIHEHEPQLGMPLAHLMNHHLKTAKKEYFLKEKKKTVSSTSSRLQEIIRRPIKTSDHRIAEIFGEEIESGSIKIADVRRGVSLYEELCGWDEKKLLDKVGVLMCYYNM